MGHRPKFASLDGSMVRRGMTTRRVRIIGPDGAFVMADMPIEALVPARTCDSCGQTLP